MTQGTESWRPDLLAVTARYFLLSLLHECHGAHDEHKQPAALCFFVGVPLKSITAFSVELD